ncbi:MAG: NAD(P)/FAD-dependent oxidoreductase [Ruthenibacterium lactatiformans]
MSKNGKIIIIGGGASGLAAALAAAKECGGQCVTVLERLDRVGKKLLATGNGRCNLTNRNAAPEHYHSADTARLADILERTPPDAVLDFFGEMGLLCDTQADGRVYPYCYQASMVLDVLRAALERAGVDVACSCEVAEVEKGPGGFSVRTRDGRAFSAARVVLAAGGQAGPQFGTDGSAFALARMLGHSVAEPYPCLVPLRCAGFPVGLKGCGPTVRFRCTWMAGAPEPNGEKYSSQNTASRNPGHAAFVPAWPGVKKGGDKRGFFPEMAFPVLRGMLEQRCASGMFASLETLLLGLVAKKLGHAILKAAACSRFRARRAAFPAGSERSGQCA